MNTSVRTQGAAAPVGAYPHARQVGEFLFLSGIGPRSATDNSIPEGIEAQCESVFQNVRAVLSASGYEWQELVDVTVFLTHMSEDFAAFNRAYAAAFSDPKTQPCRTTVEVTRLPTPIRIELKCIAAHS